MSQTLDTHRIDILRKAARHIVRELGFMQKGLAGTDLSPSAVHTIIEIGYGTVMNANELAALLHLEKSSVSRLIQKLEKDGLIKADCDSNDRRSRILSLTQKGELLLNEVEQFARAQLHSALDGLAENDVNRIETGLVLFAGALDIDAGFRPGIKRDVRVHEGYLPGIISMVTQLHISYYSENYSFGSVFEQKVATEMSDFMARIDKPINAVFSAYSGDRLLGAVSLDGEDLGKGAGHLRWFIVSPEAQGIGIGTLLLEKAMAFVDHNDFECTRLWTFKGLNAARRLYEKHGFALVDEKPGTQWGTKVIEQEFRRERISL